MSDDVNYVEGKLYYLLGRHPLGDADSSPSIETWMYQGIKKFNHSSTSCDTPYHFLVFQRVTAGGPAEERIKVPSVAQARRSYLSWEQLCRNIDSQSPPLAN